MEYRRLCANGHVVEPGGRGTCSKCGAAVLPTEISQDETLSITPAASSDEGEATPAADQQSPAATTGETRDFVLGELAGSGGLGEVYQAFDSKLQRTVALKRVREGLPQTQGVVQRFLAESRITARLEHPGIVPVHSLGQDDHGVFYTMKLIGGETLRDAVKKHFAASGAVNRELLRRFVGTCQAVDFAHSRRVIHRDIKPANIMLGHYGETILLDWGLAKSLDGPAEPAPSPVAGSGGGKADLTRTGYQMGTPNYMAPEQARGAVHEHNIASDVYSLGAVLFFVLHGVSPQSGPHSHATTSPPQPGGGNEGPGQDGGRDPAQESGSTRKPAPHPAPALLAIAAKAMSKKQVDRYPTAAALAQDVQHWLDDEPVSVYQDSLPVRLLRWMRRHKTVVMVGAVILVLGVAAILINDALVHREQQRTLAQERLTRLQLARSNIAEADALAAGGNPFESLQRIQSAEGLFAGLGVSDDAAVLATLDVVWRHGGPSLSSVDVGARFRDAAICEGRAEALTVGDDGRLRVVNLRTSAVTDWSGDTAPLMTAVGVCAKRDLAAVGMADGSVWLLRYSARRGLWPAPIAAHRQAVRAVRFSPGGSRIATLSNDGSVWLWKAQADGQGVEFALPGREKVRAIAFASDQRLVAGYAGGFYIFTLDPTPTVTGQGKSENLTAIAANDDASMVVAGDSKGVIHQWKGHDEAESAFALHSGVIHRLILSPDSRVVCFAAENGGCGLLDRAGGEVLRTISPSAASSVRFADVDWERGLAITVVPVDASWRLESWNLRGNPVETILANSRDVRRSVAFSPAGSLLVGVRANGRVAAWDLDSGLEVLPRASLPAAATVLLSSDGQCALASTDSFSTLNVSAFTDVAVLSTTDGHTIAHLKEHARSSQFRVISADAKQAATLVDVDPGKEWTLGLWDLAAPKKDPVRSFELSGFPAAGAYSPDGHLLAIGLENGRTVLAGVDGGQHEMGEGTAAVRDICFLAGSDEIVAGYADGTLRLWSTRDFSRRAVAPGAHPGGVTSIAADGGNLIFSAGKDGNLRVWNRQLELIRTIVIGHALELLALNPTGDCLVFRDEDGLHAVHLDFAKRILHTNLTQVANTAGPLPQRYLALGRPDWLLQSLPADGTAGVSFADVARAFWKEGRLAEAQAAFSSALKAQPDDPADLKECLRKVQSLPPGPSP